jgi:hypothetical protein
MVRDCRRRAHGRALTGTGTIHADKFRDPLVAASRSHVGLLRYVTLRAIAEVTVTHTRCDAVTDPKAFTMTGQAGGIR